MWILYLLVGIALVLATLAVCVFLARMLWRSGTAGKVVVALALLALGPTLYRAVVPSAAAYRAEFTRLSGLPLPPSATVLDRSASFPDHRGRYHACLVVQLPPSAAAGLQRRLSVPLGAAPLRPCGMMGRIGNAGTAAQYRVSHRDPAEEALMTIAIDPAGGYLKAEWQIRKHLKAH